MPTIEFDNGYQPEDYDRILMELHQWEEQQEEYQAEIEQFPLFHWRETCKPLFGYDGYIFNEQCTPTAWTLPF